MSNTLTPAPEVLRLVRMVGRFGWLGGYTHAVLMDDGGILCARCTHDNYRLISWATRHQARDGWEAFAVFAVDDGPETCDHCGKEIV